MLYLYLNMHACSLVPYLSLSHIYTHTLSLFHTHSFTCSFTSLSHSHYQNPYSDAPVLNHLNLIWIPLTHWTLSLFFSLSPTLLPAHLSHLRRPSLLSLSLSPTRIQLSLSLSVANTYSTLSLSLSLCVANTYSTIYVAHGELS